MWDIDKVKLGLTGSSGPSFLGPYEGLLTVELCAAFLNSLFGLFY